jgi:hypothetical protein
MYYVFFIGMILADLVAVMAFYKAYSKSKMPMLGILTLWFTSRFFAGLLSFIWNSGFHWNPIHVQNVTTLFEAYLMVKFCMLFITKKVKFLNVLWVLPAIIYGIELYVYDFSYDSYHYSTLSYYLITSLLLIQILVKEKIPKDRLNFVNIMFVFHICSVVFIGSLDILLDDVELFKMVYPFVWIIYMAVDILSLWALRKWSKQLFEMDLMS